MNTRFPVRPLFRAAAVAIGLALQAPRTVQAQLTWSPRLQLDNDLYNFWKYYTKRPDEQYTNGVQATLESYDAPWWGARFASRTPNCRGLTTTKSACRATALTLGQDMYTPNKRHLPFANADWERERPYFAWTYVGATARLLSARRQRTYKVSLGVTGAPAGGRVAQTVVHALTNSDAVSGWETQIGFEPGVQVEHRQSVLLAQQGGNRRLGMSVQPAMALIAGNIRTAAELGGTMRLGWNLSHPWDPRVMRDRAPVEYWLSVGGRGNLIARDMSLDGTLFNRTRHVQRTPVVLQYEFGGGVRVHQFVLEYRATTRSREYHTGPRAHSHSSIIAAVSVLP
ncbi:MAG: lipid A deacylase LpxR family protein [Gemmatimonadaceae bacterium]|nr:lipid A deacylase LpxR family protein [Gemmatimonadaceae bacterium]